MSRLLDSLLKDYDNSLRPDFWGGLTGYPHENIVEPEMLNLDEKLTSDCYELSTS